MTSWLLNRRRRRAFVGLLALLALVAAAFVSAASAPPAAAASAPPAAAAPVPLAAAAPPAPPCGAPENMVPNCGFETGSLSPWTLTGGTGSNAGVDTTTPRTGAYAAFFGDRGTVDDQISQPIAGTTYGQTYLVEFWVRNDDSSANNHFSAWVSNVAAVTGTVTLLDRTNANAFGWTMFAGSFIASDGAPTLTFAGRSGTADYLLDDVSVTVAATDCSSVPGNLVADCGFESGLAPWVVAPFDALDTGTAGIGAGQSGSAGAYFSGSNTSQFLQPVSGTTPGTTYLVQFWWGQPDFTINASSQLLAQVSNTANGTVTLFNRVDNPNPDTGMLFAGTFVAGAGTPTVSIGGFNQMGEFYFDEVSMSPAAPTLTVSPAALPDPSGGAVYSQALAASGTFAPYSFQVTSGSLPAGLTLAADGTLSGTPTEYGPASFTVTATDGVGYSGSQAYTLTVQPSAISVSGALPAATYGTPYTASVSASGGTAPYTYAVTDGALPAGLTLDGATGTISGTPTAAGDYSFAVQATDSGTGTGPATGAQAYALSVAKATPTLEFTAPTSGGVVGDTAPIATTTAAPDSSASYSSGSPDVCAVSGATVTYLHPGLCEIDADQPATENYLATTAHTVVPVSQAGTGLALRVRPHRVVAIVSANPPGAGTPTGTVSFAVDGTHVGDAQLSGGRARLDYTVPAGMTRLVTAVYSGNRDFTGWSASTARRDPSITARVTSAHAKTRAGWYRSPIAVHFTCTPNGAPLTHPCPKTMRLTRNGAGRSVTGTIHSADGGVATVAVAGLNLDRTPPKVRVRGIRNGAIYAGHAPRATCVAHDRLSGVASCRIRRQTHGTVTRYTAVATDRAGNRSTVTGRYRVTRN